jgi:hypothetical protein
MKDGFLDRTAVPVAHRLLHVPATFPPNVERSVLLQLVRDLVRERDELVKDQQTLKAYQEDLDGILAQIRSCTDDRCHVCPRCATAIFVKAQPAPQTLPLKYEVPGPWRT